MDDKLNNSLYHDALGSALKELEDAMAERDTLDERIDAVDRRIVRLRQAAIGMGALVGRPALSSEFPDLFPDSIDPDKGLTEAVREILRTHHPYYHSPIQVRDALRDKGYPISKYKNVLASIHTVLKRLKTQDEVKESNRNGRTVYCWIKRDNDPEGDDIPF